MLWRTRTESRPPHARRPASTVRSRSLASPPRGARVPPDGEKADEKPQQTAADGRHAPAGDGRRLPAAPSMQVRMPVLPLALAVARPVAFVASAVYLVGVVLASRSEQPPALRVPAWPHLVHPREQFPRVRGSCFSFAHSCVLVHVSVDSPALLRTTPDRRPPLGQPFFNIHWARALSPSVPEEDAPRRRGTIRKSNMNPKNIGSYMKGKEEEGKQRELSPATRRRKKRRPPPAGGRMDLMKN